MEIKKILSGLLAAVLAFGTMAVLPEEFEDIAIAVSAESADDGFVLDIDEDGIKFVSGYTGKGGNITIPSEAEYVGALAFYRNPDITCVTIPKTCTVGTMYYSFGECKNLKKVIFEGGTEFVGAASFYGCKALEEVVIKGDMHRDEQDGGIWSLAFDGCEKLKKVVIEGDVQYIDPSAFDDCGDFTMTVIPGSYAEKYCRENGFLYEYGKLPAPTGFKAKKTASSITLTWDAVDGADAYRVYLYNSKTGKYERYKTVSSAKCTIKDLNSGTKYKIKVVALQKQDNGKYKSGKTSKAVSVTTKTK